MVVVPDDNPVSTPVAAFIVPTAVLLLLHVPPDTVSDKVVVLSRQTTVLPVMAGGTGMTVTGLVKFTSHKA